MAKGPPSNQTSNMSCRKFHRFHFLSRKKTIVGKAFRSNMFCLPIEEVQIAAQGSALETKNKTELSVNKKNMYTQKLQCSSFETVQLLINHNTSSKQNLAKAFAVQLCFSCSPNVSRHSWLFHGCSMSQSNSLG